MNARQIMKNEKVIEAIALNSFEPHELAQIIRQVYRQLDKLEADTEAKCHTLQDLLKTADYVERWFELRRVLDEITA